MFRTFRFRRYPSPFSAAFLGAIILTVGIGMTSNGQPRVRADEKAVVNEYCRQMREFSAAEAEEIATQYSAGKIGDATRGALRIAGNAAQQLSNKTLPDKERVAASRASVVAWLTVLDITSTSSDVDLKEQVVASWDQGLSHDYSALCQLAALTADFSRTLLTNRFWRLFEETQNLYIIRAICHTMAEHGSKEDIVALEKKARLTNNGFVRGEIGNAINYIRYHSQARKDWNIPSQAPPMMPGIEEVLKAEHTGSSSAIRK